MRADRAWACHPCPFQRKFRLGANEISVAACHQQSPHLTPGGGRYSPMSAWQRSGWLRQAVSGDYAATSPGVTRLPVCHFRFPGLSASMFIFCVEAADMRRRYRIYSGEVTKAFVPGKMSIRQMFAARRTTTVARAVREPASSADATHAIFSNRQVRT